MHYVKVAAILGALVLFYTTTIDVKMAMATETASFAAHLSEPGVTPLVLSSTAGGTVLADPALAFYPIETIVTLTATPAIDCFFSSWGGENGGDVFDPENDGIGTILMNGSKQVVAQFTCGECRTLQISSNSAYGGTVSVSPPRTCPWGWLTDTCVTIIATPNMTDGFRFLNFSGKNAGELFNISPPDSETGAVTANLVMDGDKTIIAKFVTEVSCGRFVLLNAETMPEGWIFGGVVREFTGTALSNETPIFIDGVQVQGFRAAPDYTSIDIVIPPYTGSSKAAYVDVDVQVGTGIDACTLPNAFRYKRHEVKKGVRSTAFILENPKEETTIAMTLDGTAENTTPVTLPALKTPAGVSRLFGIARNADAIPETKINTDTLGSLGTGYISILTGNGVIPAGLSIDNAYDFSLHLYTDYEEKINMPPAGSASYFSLGGLLDFDRPVDAAGNPNPDTAAITVQLPLNQTGLNYGDVRTGLTLWGVGTAFDYVTGETTILKPPAVAYQSELLNNEVVPGLTFNTPDTNQPNAMIARLYSLNGFSLRSGANFTTEMQEGVKLFRRSGANWVGYGTVIGDLNGGLELKIVSPMGGIAWVDRIEFRSAEKCAVIATATESDFLTTPGSDEYNLVFRTPESSDVGITDLAIFLKSNPTMPAVTLERVFQYTYPKLSIIRETAQRLLGSFYSLDTNADSALSILEARVLIPDLKPCMFNLLDRNNDGKLSLDELEMAASHGICGCNCQKNAIQHFDIRKALGDLLLFGISVLILMPWSAFRRS
ncbi:MAG TPA: hypothetical protein PLI09_21265 [Candidatus Hydrogenedentes bacterium]|nr:hypothetical protein [Candidatus Hydrogenedentota bacterium]